MVFPGEVGGERTLRIPPSCSDPVSHACGPHVASFVRRSLVCALGRLFLRAGGRSAQRNAKQAERKSGRRNAKQKQRKSGRPRKGWEPQRRKRKTPRVPQDHHRRFVALPPRATGKRFGSAHCAARHARPHARTFASPSPCTLYDRRTNDATCGPQAWLTGSLHEGGIRSARSPLRRPPLLATPSSLRN